MNEQTPSRPLRRSAQVLAKIIRVITLPPFMAAALVLLLRACCGAFEGIGLWVALFCLTVLPLLSYGVWYILPVLRAQGRKSQRKLAVICSCLGYVLNSAYCILAHRGSVETVAILTYLLSGLLIAVLSYVCKVKGSGHACGLSGPTAMAALRVHPLLLAGYFFLIPVAWSSLKLKRHTWAELAIGAVIPVAVQLILMRLPV